MAVSSWRVVSIVVCFMGLALGAAGCGEGELPEEFSSQEFESQQPDPARSCVRIECGAGHCEMLDGRPTCVCDPGHHAEGLTCVDGAPSSASACEPNPCITPYKTDCSVDDGAVSCSCLAGYVPDGTGCKPPAQPGDDHGNTKELATSIEPSTTEKIAQIEAGGDVDFFVFTAVAGHIYQVNCNPTNNAFDCDLTLMDAAGTVIVADTRSNTTASWRRELNTGGTYFFKVHVGNSTSTGSYVLRFEDHGVDDVGDTAATAASVQVSTTPYSGTLETAGDYDWYSFTAIAGHIYQLTCNPTGNAFDCDLLLANAAGQDIASDTSSNTTARLRLELNAGGTYFFRVKSGGSTSLGAYTFLLEDLGVDDIGDTTATATPILVSTTAYGTLETVGDHDWFSFTAVAGHIYQVSCNPTGNAFDCDLALANAAGTVIASDTASSLTARILMELNTGGTYFIRVKSGGSTTYGAYSVRIEDLGVDDIGDTQAAAMPLALSTTQGGRLETVGDYDWFSFTAVAGHIYQMDCAPTANAFDCDLLLTNAAGTSVASDTRSSLTARILVELNTGGTYFFRVKAGIDGGMGNYTVRVEDTGVDDAGDTQATARAIQFSAVSTAGSLETVGDVDWFSFTAAAGQSVDFFCTTTAFDCDLFLYNASGTLVTSDTRSSLNATVSATLTTAGTYYVRLISGNSPPTSGAYSFRLNDRGVTLR